MHSIGAHSTKRILGYDVLRVVSIVAVVATHVLMVYRGTPDQNAITSALDDLLHFAVPAFFFVSGALVWGAYRGRSLRDYVSFLHKRASVVLGPYLVWSALYLLIDVFRGDRLYWLSNSPLLLLTDPSTATSRPERGTTRAPEDSSVRTSAAPPSTRDPSSATGRRSARDA